ncbi:hypothetical protein DQQ10_18935 [Pseudochryseolinea flava]|uniref:Uncharacterized protein n=1 Tax=Pseudochryseolinea flava TaxID=2059302 RepID=A0A364XYY4_9BACT|nr:hypothetical protein DQQ10_18935 [Pseudochryseolinea flava]
MTCSIISESRLASHKSITIYLIEQQLKSKRFFDDVESIGLGCYDFQPNLDHLILKNLALDDGSDNTFELYSQVMHKHSQLLKPNFKAIHNRSRKAYSDLVALKRRVAKTK